MENLLGPLFSAIAGIGAAWLTFAKLKKMQVDEIDKKIQLISEQNAKDLKSQVSLVSLKLEAIEKDLVKIEADIEREISYVKEAYKGDVKNLTEKIENLRDEMRKYNDQMIHLLTKMVSDKS